MGRTLRRVALLVVLLGVGLTVSAGRAAADEGLDVRSDILFTPRPEAGYIDVQATFALTNVKPTDYGPTSYTQYSFAQFTLLLPRASESFSARWGDIELDPEVTPREGTNLSEVKIPFPHPLYFQDAATIELHYRLPGLPERSEDLIRASPSLAVFPVWACCDDGMSSVRIAVPKGFDISFAPGADLFRRESVDGQAFEQAIDIAHLDEFFAVAYVANTDAAAVETVQVVGIEAVVKSWAGDEEWMDFVVSTLEAELPVLQDLIGVPWPQRKRLTVVESVNPRVSGFGGWYDDGTIEMGEALEQTVLIHELAHAWFNKNTFDDRWIIEGLAEEFTSWALARPGDAPEPPTVPDPDYPDAVSLLAWTQPDRVESEEERLWEAYHYDASWWLFRQLSDEIGIDGLSQVVAAAMHDEISFLGDQPPETYAVVNGWKRLLDLAEQRGGSEAFENLVRDYVLTPGAAFQLEERSNAHVEYDELIEQSGAWAPPLGLRRDMSAWRFTSAEAVMRWSHEILRVRDTIAALAAELGLPLDDALERDYEQAESIQDLQVVGERASMMLIELRAVAEERRVALDVLAAEQQRVESAAQAMGLTVAPQSEAVDPSEVASATDEARDQLVSLEILRGAEELVAADRSWITGLGMLGRRRPEVLLGAAQAAFEANDLDGVALSVARAENALEEAESAGRRRVAGAGVGTLLISLAILLTRRVRAGAGAGASGGAEAAGSAQP